MQIQGWRLEQTERSGWVGEGSIGEAESALQEEAGCRGQVQGQGGEGVGPGHVCEGGGFIGCTLI